MSEDEGSGGVEGGEEALVEVGVREKGRCGLGRRR